MYTFDVVKFKKLIKGYIWYKDDVEFVKDQFYSVDELKLSHPWLFEDEYEWSEEQQEEFDALLADCLAEYNCPECDVFDNHDQVNDYFKEWFPDAVKALQPDLGDYEGKLASFLKFFYDYDKQKDHYA